MTTTTAHTFHLDTEDPSTAPTITAIAEGPRWNGWRSPVVTAAAMRAFVAHWRSIDPNGTWGEVREMAPADGVPVLVVTRSDSDDPDDWDVWPGEYVDNGTPVYEVSGWVWTGADQ